MITRKLTSSSNSNDSPFDMLQTILNSQVRIKDRREQWTKVSYQICDEQELDDRIIQIVGGNAFCFGKNGEFKGIMK